MSVDQCPIVTLLSHSSTDNNCDHVTVLLGCANGFVPQVYLPMLNEIYNQMRLKTPSLHFQCICLPVRAMWRDQVGQHSNFRSWRDLADDILLGMQQHSDVFLSSSWGGRSGVIAIGHSFSAVALFLAATIKPRLFAAIVMLDPTINGVAASAYAAASRRRKQYFIDEEDARSYVLSRSTFLSWHPLCVKEYIKHGFIKCNQDQRLMLAYDRDWEGIYYDTSDDSSFFPEIARMSESPSWCDPPSLSLFVLGGLNPDSLFTYSLRSRVCQSHLAKRGLVSVATVQGGHLFPMEHPVDVAVLVAGHLLSIEAKYAQERILRSCL